MGYIQHFEAIRPFILSTALLQQVPYRGDLFGRGRQQLVAIDLQAPMTVFHCGATGQQVLAAVQIARQLVDQTVHRIALDPARLATGQFSSIGRHGMLAKRIDGAFAQSHVGQGETDAGQQPQQFPAAGRQSGLVEIIEIVVTSWLSPL